MKKSYLIVIVLLIILAIWGVVASVEKSSDISKRPSEMTQEERTQELENMLQSVGVVLPENWEDMTSKERGKFLIDSKIVPPEAAPVFEK